MAAENQQRIVGINDTKANCTALTGTPSEIIFAHTTDTGELGVYVGGAWYWESIPTLPVNVYNETISADGSSTIYYLLNIAAPSTIRVYIDGIRQPASDDTDPTDVVTFSVAPDLGAVLLFDYEMDMT